MNNWDTGNLPHSPLSETHNSFSYNIYHITLIIFPPLDFECL